MFFVELFNQSIKFTNINILNITRKKILNIFNLESSGVFFQIKLEVKLLNHHFILDIFLFNLDMLFLVKGYI